MVLYNTAFPMVLIALLGYVSKDRYGGLGITSYDYYGLTILLFAILNVTSTAANSFMEARLKASNLRVLYTPVPEAFVYGAKIAATFVFAACCLATVMASSRYVLHVNFGGSMLVAYIAVLLLLFILLCAAIGVLFCCIFRSEELANKILSIVTSVMALGGGLLFPLDGVSPLLAALSWLSPAKWMAQAVFQIVYDADIAMFYPAVGVLLLALGLTVTGCALTFRKEDYV